MLKHTSAHALLRKAAGVGMALLMMLLWGQGAVWAEGQDPPPVESEAPQLPVGDVQVDLPADPDPPALSPSGSPAPSPSDSPVPSLLDAPAPSPLDAKARLDAPALSVLDTDNKLGCTDPASIGDYVWADADGDGVQDPGENGISGVNVKLYRNGSYMKQTTTNGAGAYHFGNLEAGTYKVKFGDKSGYAFTHKDAGSDNAKDSDAGSDGYTGNIVLSAGADVTTVDCGYVERDECSIGDFVWNDANGNGVQDAGETGIPGVSVRLYQGSDYVKSDNTDGSGKYAFDGLDAGTYQVKFPAISGRGFTVKDAGGNDAQDSDAGSGGMTGDIVLSWGGSDMTVDCGYRPLSSIANYVWFDSNKNGIQDDGPAGIDDVTVKLYQGTDKVAETETNWQGRYEFDGLQAGTYRVLFPAIPGREFTHLHAGSNDDADSDAGGGGYTADIVLGWGETNNTVDAGYVCHEHASLGDFAWHDVNGNGIQETGETGINGITVRLYHDGDPVPVAATSTATHSGKPGWYTFTGLDAGTYQVGFGAAPGKVITAKDAGPDGSDSDAGSSGMTGDIVLFWGDCDCTVDCGYRVPAQLGDLAWYDVNENGVQDAGEIGIGGVGVQLYHDGSVVDSTTTAYDGSYHFSGLPAGAYKVKFGAKAGYAYTAADAGGDDARDSDADAAGFTADVTLDWGENDATVDCGYLNRATASLGDFVWYDVDGDGVQDATDGICGGVAVDLYKDGGKVAETTSDASGHYSFTGLEAGVYRVKFQDKTASGYGFTAPDAGGDDALDSDASVATGFTADVVLDWGENDTSVDCGYTLLPRASLGDLVWYDVDGDGVQDAADGIFGGVVVELYKDGSKVAETTSNGSGLYSFTGLEAGVYRVKFPDMAASGYGFTAQDTGGDDALDSDASGVTGFTADVALDWGENDTSVDCGYAALAKASLGDFVWQDSNFNGVQDAGEPGLEGVTVDLYQNDVLKTSAVTNSSGLYAFTGLDAGDYKVKFHLPSGMSFSPADVGDDVHDSDAGAAGMTPVVSLTWGENDTTVDCGVAAPGTLGDYVWLDTDQDGIQDSGEPAVPDVAVQLYKGAALVGSTVTNGGGYYEFTGLMPGTYHVKLTLPPDGTLGYTGFAFTCQCASGSTEANDSNPDGSGLCASFFLTSGEHVMTMDAGLIAIWCSIGDFVWLDSDKDGLQDAGEPGLGGVTVSLYSLEGDALTFEKSTVTDSVGAYRFCLLPVGDYEVQFVKPATYDQTVRDAGAETIDSDAGLDGYSHIIVLNTGYRDDTKVDAGYYRSTCSLGDRVWLDRNWNGVQDPGEPGLNGITVELYAEGGADPLAATVTADHAGQPGWYLFEGLGEGSYRVKVIVDGAQYLITTAHTCAEDADSDIEASGFSPIVMLDYETDRNDTTLDAGLRVPCSIGDYVWLDKPKSGLPGVQESDEPGKNNVKVELYRQVNGAMQLVASTVTASHAGKDGWYCFEGLQEGAYQVKFIILEAADYEFVPYHAGSDDAKDSDAGAQGMSPLITLSVAGHRSDMSIDAGVRIPSTGGIPAGIFYGAGGALLLAGVGLSLPFFLKRRQKIAAALRLLKLRLTTLLARK